ncbi:hypothetical protein [Prosthecobacter sp.]|uniref:hypothetical protein n=1 Tax=Prosthecobacter sp. TaxID=1965333 RepID=UPI001D1F2D1A|nr:hypothetical protein [Prosthecobacter sp.]MCB1278996.1 hypothetical protein [Prosthecobacter sp.]
MKTTSSKWKLSRVLLAVLLSSAAGWWFGAYEHLGSGESKEARMSLDEFHNWWRIEDLGGQIEASRKRVGELAWKFAADAPVYPRREKEFVERKPLNLTIRQQTANPLEFGTPEPIRRPIWNGPTDPDSVWHDQRRRANQTLVRHGLPSLEGGTTFQVSPAPPHRPRVKFQK